MHALLLIDLQNDFITSGALAVPDGNAVIPIANRIMGHYDFVVATQDWHPAGHGSFAESHSDVKIGDLFQLAGLPQVAWPVHCVQHTPGAQFVDELDTKQLNHITRKGTDPEIDSYSGFYDNGHRKATDLERTLQDNHVRCIDVMGLATDYCVKFTALDALTAGFETRLIVDGCRGVNLQPGDVDNAIKEMRQSGVTMIHSIDIFSSTKKQKQRQ